MSQEATKKKKQLMMLLFPVYKPLELPEGCAITHYRGPEDIPVWIELCKNGLATEDAGRDFFDALITNFHLPESTLVMLVSALAGRENVLNAYEEAIRERYRFFSFGDAMFIK